MQRSSFCVRMPTSVLLSVTLAGLQACAQLPPTEKSNALLVSPQSQYVWLNRVTWGVNTTAVRQLEQAGQTSWLQQQLQPREALLPDSARATVQSMTISQVGLTDLVFKLEQWRKDADAVKDDGENKAAQQAYQSELTRLSLEARMRHLLRALYSPSQVQEQMTWFWLNHFNVHIDKHNLRAMLGDYEDSALRPHALGRFRELLAAVTYHPAMLRYLDNELNASGHINENFARELMELHTLGVDGGYSQADVRALARVLTGWTVDPSASDGFRFVQRLHDTGDKQVLGKRFPDGLFGGGEREGEQAIRMLARQPQTARRISLRLAQFFVADTPPPALVQQLSQTFLATQGDMRAVMRWSPMRSGPRRTTCSKPRWTLPARPWRQWIAPHLATRPIDATWYSPWAFWPVRASPCMAGKHLTATSLTPPPGWLPKP
jgi:Protein of unknown function (DUF1800)